MNKNTILKNKMAARARLNELIATAKKDPEFLTVSRQNKKLVPNETTAFIIWNLPAIKTCPYACPHCKAACYAIKAEKAYPDCLPSRERHFKDSLSADFVYNMACTILKIASGTNKQQIIVRIHESGDFYNKAYAEKWLSIMDLCKVDSRIKFIAYTKSFPYFDGVTLPKNFAFRASVWDDTKPQFLEMINRNGWNIYTAVEKFQKGDSFTRCRCSDCATCKKCWQNYKDIRCEIH